MSGGSGRDVLSGGLGRDIVTGGTGADVFAFDRFDSGKTAATRDVVRDFHRAERDELLLPFDGNDGAAGDQTLKFIGSKGFTAPGQVRFSFEGVHTVVSVNTSGTTGAELQIQLDGRISLTAGDFLFAD